MFYTVANVQTVMSDNMTTLGRFLIKMNILGILIDIGQ